jgi:hypothetical protein
MAAIYMWFSPEDLEILTTTLYPIEVIDKIEFGVSLIGGSMTPVPLEAYEGYVLALGGDISTVKQSTGPHDEAYESFVAALGGSITNMLITDGPYDEAYDSYVLALDGLITEALVKTFMPDDGIRFGCSLIGGSMTHV